MNFHFPINVDLSMNNDPNALDLNSPNSKKTPMKVKKFLFSRIHANDFLLPLNHQIWTTRASSNPKIRNEGIKEKSPPGNIRANKNNRATHNNLMNSSSRSPSGLSKPQKSIGYSNDIIETSPRMKSPSPLQTPQMKKEDSFKNLIFWNKNEKANFKNLVKKENTTKNDAQILKEIGSIIKKIQNNGDKTNRELSPMSRVKQIKLNTLRNTNISDKISEESTKTTFENNLSEKPAKNILVKPLDIREQLKEDKNKIALTLLKMKNNKDMFLDKTEILKQLNNFKTQADFFRRNDLSPKTEKNKQKPQESPKNNFRITNYNAGFKMKSKEAYRTKSPEIEHKKEENESGITLKDCKNNIEDYDIKEVLGQGSYASVRLGVLKETQKKFAIKIYDKIKLLDAQKARNVKREITILQAVCHENIIKLYQTIDTSKWLYLVMEYAGHSSLHSYLKNKSGRKLKEDEGKYIFKQVVEGISYLHSKNVIHRDIKLENLLLDDNKILKIIDFGFSVCVKKEQKINNFCGTPTYMAPEIVSKKEYFGAPVDVWALGVLLYVLLCGTFPFKAQEEKELYKKIIKGTFDFPHHLSYGAKNLISKLLMYNPFDRLESKDILLDLWLNPMSASNIKEFKNIINIK